MSRARETRTLAIVLVYIYIPDRYQLDTICDPYAWPTGLERGLRFSTSTSYTRGPTEIKAKHECALKKSKVYCMQQDRRRTRTREYINIILYYTFGTGVLLPHTTTARVALQAVHYSFEECSEPLGVC